MNTSRNTIETIVGLVRDTSSSLPEDVEKALRRALRLENAFSIAHIGSRSASGKDVAFSGCADSNAVAAKGEGLTGSDSEGDVAFSGCADSNAVSAHSKVSPECAFEGGVASPVCADSNMDAAKGEGLTGSDFEGDVASPACAVLGTILENCAAARKASTPLCQDTGTLTFFIDPSLRRRLSLDTVKKAVAVATERGFLRRNCIDAIDGTSYDGNCSDGAPVIHYVPNRIDSRPAATLLMKGGGSENMSRQYSLPDESLGAGRDLEGVRIAILDAVHRAQGYGCAPGILGVCIGGDRATGYETAKEQLLRNLEDSSPDPRLARLERKVLDEANSLGIGPMGLGGRTTLLGVKIAARPRVPASFFVTVAYMCWALRRRSAAF